MFGEYLWNTWYSRRLVLTYSVGSIWRGGDWAVNRANLFRLREFGAELVFTEYALTDAACTGNLEVVKWVRAAFPELCPCWPAMAAASRGKQDIVDWLMSCLPADYLCQCGLFPPGHLDAAMKTAHDFFADGRKPL